MASIFFLLFESNPVSDAYVLTRCTSRDGRHLDLFVYVSTREGEHLFLWMCGNGQDEEKCISAVHEPDITTFLPVSQNGCDAETRPCICLLPESADQGRGLAPQQLHQENVHNIKTNFFSFSSRH